MKCLTLFICLLAFGFYAQPPMPPKSSVVIRPKIASTNKPMALVLHWSTVIFTAPKATNCLAELQMKTNLSSTNWQTVAWYPCCGQVCMFTMSNNVIPIAFFRAGTLRASVSNLTLVIH